MQAPSRAGARSLSPPSSTALGRTNWLVAGLWRKGRRWRWGGRAGARQRWGSFPLSSFLHEEQAGQWPAFGGRGGDGGGEGEPGARPFPFPCHLPCPGRSEPAKAPLAAGPGLSSRRLVLGGRRRGGAGEGQSGAQPFPFPRRLCCPGRSELAAHRLFQPADRRELEKDRGGSPPPWSFESPAGQLGGKGPMGNIGMQSHYRSQNPHRYADSSLNGALVMRGTTVFILYCICKFTKFFSNGSTVPFLVY